MLSIKECRKKLGKKYEHLSDEEIEQIRDYLMELAKINVEIIKNVERKVANGETTWEEVLGEE